MRQVGERGKYNFGSGVAAWSAGGQKLDERDPGDCWIGVVVGRVKRCGAGGREGDMRGWRGVSACIFSPFSECVECIVVV